MLAREPSKGMNLLTSTSLSCAPLSLLTGMTLMALLSCAGPAPPEPPQPATLAEIVGEAVEAEERGDPDLAVARYGEAFQRDPSNLRIRRRLAAAHMERARRVREEEGVFGLEAAERDVREAWRLEPADPAIRSSLAALLVERSVREMSPHRAQALREEARALDPDVALVGEGARADVDRRLDLAFELVERGQIDAGLERLEAIHADEPRHRPTARLLGRTLVLKALMRSERGRHAEAGALLDRAVEVYPTLPTGEAESESSAELREELQSVHRSRIVAWLNAARPEDARRALDEAEQAGFRFPDLAPTGP